jgi:hypothetical protein
MPPLDIESVFSQRKNSMGQGELSSMRNAESCHRSDCSRPVVVTFRAEALCLDHFCARCYEFLDGIDPRQQLNKAAPGSAVEHVLIADECARRALDICMSATILNNLERARLLDILLWCGDISNAHHPKNVRAECKDANTPHEKPVLKRHVNSTRTVPF